MAVYDTKEIDILRAGGKRLAAVLREVAKAVRPGIKTKELDDLAERLIRQGGDTPAFLRYTPEGAGYPYPATLCVSVNDEVVHGIPGERVLLEGDVVGLDLGLVHEGLVADAAVTVAVGETDEKSGELISAAREALMKGIAAVRSGARVGDIGHAVGNHAAARGYSVVKELGGHGVGKRVHEDPYIPNFGKGGIGVRLVPGMVLAIEPMLNMGTEDVKLSNDGYTWKTRDGKRSAHFEHTIAVTERGAEILTQ